MSEFEPRLEINELREKAELWLAEARLALEAIAGSEYIEPADNRFLERTTYGLNLSERPIIMLALALDRRQEFLDEHGVDIIAEQFRILKLALDKSPDLLR